MFSPKKDLHPPKRPWVLALVGLSAFLTFLVYSPVLNNDFVNWDDPFYIQKNPNIFRIDFSTLRWMWTSSYTGNWIPLSWLSLAVDYQWGNLNPQAYHFTNLVLHCANVTLVFLISLRVLMIPKGKEGQKPALLPREAVVAFLASFVFGIHPLHVESVVWASERKDLLCGLFFLTSLFLYLDYLYSYARQKWKLILCFMSFLLALFSKSMAVTLPVALLVLDYWPGRRFHKPWARILLEKLPFFLAALVVGMVTVLFQSGTGALSNLGQLPLSFRVMNAFHSIGFYLEKLVLPANLVTFYPIYLRATFSPEYFLTFLAVVLIGSVVFIYRKRYPFLYAAGLYYLVTLAPVLGLLQVGSQSAADRYTYLPSVALILLFAFAGVHILVKSRVAFVLVLVGVVAALGYGTIKQVGFWKDSTTLWLHELAVYPKNAAYAYSNLADALEQTGRLEEALQLYELALQKGPRVTYAHAGKGEVLLKKGAIEASIVEFKTSIDLDGKYDVPHDGLGQDYEKQGLYPQALSETQEAIRINPNNAEAYYHLGMIHRAMSNFDKSLEAFRKAIYLDPGNSEYSRNLIETCRMERFDVNQKSPDEVMKTAPPH